MEYVRESDFEVDHNRHNEGTWESKGSLHHIDSKTDLDFESSDPFFEYTFKIQQNLSLTWCQLMPEARPRKKVWSFRWDSVGRRKKSFLPVSSTTPERNSFMVDIQVQYMSATWGKVLLSDQTFWKRSWVSLTTLQWRASRPSTGTRLLTSAAETLWETWSSILTTNVIAFSQRQWNIQDSDSKQGAWLNRVESGQ